MPYQSRESKNKEREVVGGRGGRERGKGRGGYKKKIFFTRRRPTDAVIIKTYKFKTDYKVKVSKF